MSKFEAVFAVLFASTMTALAYQPAPVVAPPPAFVKLANVALHDVDSLRADIVLPFGVTLPDRSIRAQGFDGWEIDRTRKTVTITDEELVKGKEARKQLQSLIVASKGLYAVESDEKGVYGRVSAFLYVQQADGTMLSVAKWAEENGHCRN